METTGPASTTHVNVDGYRIPVRSKVISDLNTLRVTVGSNCPQGGDSGHGGRTVLRFEDLGSTDLRVRVTGHQLEREGGYLVGSGIGVELVFRGDAEHRTLVKALEFALNVLREAQSSKSSAGKGARGAGSSASTPEGER